MSKIASYPKFRVTDSNGDPLSGGLVYTYEVGTTTNKATYPTISDMKAKTNANDNPVVLDSRGEADIVFAGATKIVVKDSDEVTIDTIDNINDDETIMDSNGNEALDIVTTASAVNYLQVTNSATGSDVLIDAVGDDANVGLTISGKGSGAVTIDGTITADPGSAPINWSYEDSHTNTVYEGIQLTVTTDGTPAAGIGTGLLLKSESADENPSSILALHGRFTDVSAGSEDSEFVVRTRYAGNALDDAYMFSKTGAGDITFTHAATTARTVTWPDADVTISSLPASYVNINGATDLTAPATGDEIILADISDSNNVKKSDIGTAVVNGLSGATISTATVATGDKVLVQDADDSDNLKTVTTQAIADLNPTLTQEQVEDYAGALVATGGTKTGITVTYQDATGDMDFTVADTTVAGDSGSTGITPGDTLTIAGGTNATTAMSGDTLTVNVDDAFLANNGDVGTGTYDFGGADDFEIPNSATPTVDTAGQIAVDTTITDHTGLITYHDGNEALYVIALPTGNLGTTDGNAIIYNATNNEFEMGAPSAGAGGNDTEVQFNSSGSLAGASTFTWNGSALTVPALTLSGNVTDYEATNDGNPEIRLGSADAEELHIQTVYDSGAQTLDYVLLQTDAASATANKGLFRFNVDGTDICDIDDGGIDLDSSKALSIAGTDVLNATTLGTNVVTSSLTTVGALDSGSITSGFGTIDTGSSTITTTGTVSTGALGVTGNITVSGTVDGRDVATDGTKLDGIEASADVTDETNVVSSLSGATLTSVSPASDDEFLILDTSDSGNLKTVTYSDMSGGGSASQVTVDLNVTTHGFAVGDVLYLNGSTYTKAVASSAAAAEVIGVVSAVADTNNFTLLLAGQITGLTSLSAGTVYFLDPSTAGSVTSTEPSTTGQISKPVYLADSATTAVFLPHRGITIE